MTNLSQFDAVPSLNERLAKELNINAKQIAAAVTLLDEGATVPFIARYRKEVTGNLDDTQLRNLSERLDYLRELDARRAAIIQSIAGQDKLHDDLLQLINAAETKQALEDLYLPYRPKRRTRAQIAREAGLEPLADAIFNDRSLDPLTIATNYISVENKITNSQEALDGARDILSERFAETAQLVGQIREQFWQQGLLICRQTDEIEKDSQGKFKDYYQYQELIRTIPSHRALAIFRGRQLGALSIKLALEESLESSIPHPFELIIAQHFDISYQHQQALKAADEWLQSVCRWCWRVKMRPNLENELFSRLRQQAEIKAIEIFATNLRHLLLAAPAGLKTVMGLDPGIRTGVKVAVVDKTGKLLETDTVYPHEPRRDWENSIFRLAELAKRSQTELISIGNGTASRETEKLVNELIRRYPELNLHKIVVSEAGASVYSASLLAALEFPDLDVSLRGAVSIARRLQDPLAELVKIDPKAIGVGQYQHDVDPREMARTLDTVVEDCVNAVGVDVNTASVALLQKVSGLNSSLAKQIVLYRDQKGAFVNREELKNIPRFGEKTFEQAAGFLRINEGNNALDSSSVHPEAYPLVEKITASIGIPFEKLLRNSELIAKIAPKQFVDDKFGLPTITDILRELDKPGRDPRPQFITAAFNDDVNEISDLQPGMVLEGTITNVAAFGAFVDIGVHQDGLVHLSALANRFVRDANEIVKIGQIVKARVLDVDVKRKRINLSLRLDHSEENTVSHKFPKSAPSVKTKVNKSGFGAAWASIKDKLN